MSENLREVKFRRTEINSDIIFSSIKTPYYICGFILMEKVNQSLLVQFELVSDFFFKKYLTP